MSIAKNFGRLSSLLLKISFCLAIMLLFACSSKEPRTPVKELGFEAYMHKALSVDFDFEYEIIKYYVNEKDRDEFTENLVIRVTYKDLEKITNSVKSSDSCRMVSTLSGRPGEERTGTVSAYKCITKIIPEQLRTYAFFKEDVNEISFSFSDLHLTGVF